MGITTFVNSIPTAKKVQKSVYLSLMTVKSDRKIV